MRVNGVKNGTNEDPVPTSYIINACAKRARDAAARRMRAVNKVVVGDITAAVNVMLAVTVVW